MKLLYSISIFLIFCCIKGCIYGVNKKPNHISLLNDYCLKKNTWDTIAKLYTTENIKDSVFLNAIYEIKRAAFPVSILYFEKEPKELIGVDYSSVRYVFNLSIDNGILNGTSSELSEKERKRIRNRIQKILINYQCEEGKKKSEIFMSK